MGRGFTLARYPHPSRACLPSQLFLVWFTSPVGLLANLIGPAMLLYILFAFSLSDDPTRATGLLQPAEVGIILGCIFLRNVSIAAKYAYVPTCWWIKFTKADAREAQAMNVGIMFVSGWLNPPVEVLDKQLQQAARRAHINMDNYAFLYDSRLESSVQHTLSSISSAVATSAEHVADFRLLASLGRRGGPTSPTTGNPISGAALSSLDAAAIHASDNPRAGPVLRPRRPADETGAAGVVGALRSRAKTVHECASSSDDADVTTKRVSIRDMALALMLSSCPKDLMPFHVLSITISVLSNAVIFAIFMAYNVSWEDMQSPSFVIVRVSVVVLLGLNLHALVQFLMTGILDMWRRDLVAAKLTRLTQPTIISKLIEQDEDWSANVLPDSVLATPAGRQVARLLQSVRAGGGDYRRLVLPPIVDMSRQVNAFAWYRLRSLLADTGRVFYTRLQFYISTCAVLVLFMGVTALSSYYLQSDKGAAFCRNMSNDVLYIQMLLLLGTVLAVIIAIVLLGSDANEKRALQEEAFVLAAVDIDELARDVATVLENSTGAAPPPSSAGTGAPARQRRASTAAEATHAASSVLQAIDGADGSTTMGGGMAASIFARAGQRTDDASMRCLLQELRDASCTLATLQRAIKVSDETSPILVLGMRASPAMVRIIMTGLSFLAGFMIQPLYAIRNCQGHFDAPN